MIIVRVDRRGFDRRGRVDGDRIIVRLDLRAEFSQLIREGRQSIEAYCAAIESASVAPNRLPLFSAHQMGTCRMGRDKQSAVCDERGEVFGVAGLYVADASAFPASSGVNPMITVMALAKCVAERVSTS